MKQIEYEKYMKDISTGLFDLEHAKRTAQLTYQIAIHADCSNRAAQNYMDAAFWHDCGKMFLPPELLNKTEPLTDEEFDQIQSHTGLGFDYIEHSNMPNRKLRSDVALFHHERLNGSGYLGMSGKAICRAARLVAVADTFDAMTHDRPYRKAVSVDQAFTEIKKNSGRLFDEKYVNALEKYLSSTVKGGLRIYG
jgi:HD-GYP domain-containing protein (c-di-GMP phosphodiesterase class II)